MEIDFWAHSLDLEARESGEGYSEEFEDEDFDLDKVLAEMGDDDWEEVDLSGRPGD